MAECIEVRFLRNRTRIIQPRREIIRNRTFSVYPVTMIVAGVMNRTLYTINELMTLPVAWNGVPVSIQHPEEDGVPVTCNQPHIYEQQVVGQVFNAHVEGTKLKAEVWLDNELLEEIAPDVQNILQNGTELEVSTGLYCDDIDESGEFNGEEYDSIAANIRPDHLALLPGAVGACSWEDGCGIRENKKGGKKMIRRNKKKDVEFQKNNDKYLIEPLTDEELTVNELEYTELTRLMQTHLDNMDIQREKYHYLRKMYSDYVVYRVENYAGNSASSKFYKRNYTINEDSKVEWTSDPVEVREVISYTEISNNSAITHNKEDEMADKQKTMRECCTKTVDELIANNDNFSEEDRDTLLDMTESGFELAVNVAKPVGEAKEEPTTNEETDLDMDALLERANPETKAAIVYSTNLMKKEKQDLVDAIKANESNSFSDAELKGFDVDMLKKIAAMAPAKETTKPHNYAANPGGGDPAITDNDDIPEPLPNTNVEWGKE